MMNRRTKSVAKIHASHPSFGLSRPPRPIDTVLDTRDDKSSRNRSVTFCEGENKSQCDYESDSRSSDSSFMAMHKRNNHVINCIEEALSIQKTKLGDDHPSVTRSLHSLALEYKVRGRYDKSVYLLKSALDLLEVRKSPFCNIVNQGRDSGDDASVDSCESSVCASSVASFGSSVALSEVVDLHEEQSVLYSCLGNVYMLRGMYKEATDCYVNAVNKLVEADYDGSSKRVIMLLRILKRAEFKRRNHKQIRKCVVKIQPQMRKESWSSPGASIRKERSCSFDSIGIKAIGSSFETSGASWSSEGQMSI